MSTYNEPRRQLEFLSWEAHHQLSREEGTLAASQGDLLPGTVLAKLTSGGQLVVYDNTSATAGVAVAYGILAYAAPNSASTQKVTIIERLAVVDAPLINWGANATDGINDGKVDLLAKNIRFIGTDPAGAGS
jgi:hypothetical protein